MRTVLGLILILMTPEFAEARVLSLAGAKRSAERRVKQDTVAFPPSRFDGFSIGGCTRKASYIVDCTAEIRLLKPDGTCYRTVRVRFSTPDSTRVRTSYRGAPRCTSS